MRGSRPRTPGKGRVERGIRYIRSSFDQARTWTDLADLNGQAERWCHEVSGTRRWVADRTLSVAQAFAEERSKLLPLPDTACPTEDRIAVSIGKVPYARFDSNDYSVPHDRVRRTLTVLADPQRGAGAAARRSRCPVTSRRCSKRSAPRGGTRVCTG